MFHRFVVQFQKQASGTVTFKIVPSFRHENTERGVCSFNVNTAWLRREKLAVWAKLGGLKRRENIENKKPVYIASWEWLIFRSLSELLENILYLYNLRIITSFGRGVSLSWIVSQSGAWHLLVLRAKASRAKHSWNTLYSTKNDFTFSFLSCSLATHALCRSVLLLQPLKYNNISDAIQLMVFILSEFRESALFLRSKRWWTDPMSASRFGIPSWRYFGDCFKNRLQLVAGKTGCLRVLCSWYSTSVIDAPLGTNVPVWQRNWRQTLI